jgi:pimeloyl-ACP methyl ester carboxylesterase
VVGHAHGGGVALRLAATAPECVAAVYLPDVGAQANNRGPVLGSTLRLVPLITRVPGGRRFVRSRFVAGPRRNSARHDWLDAPTQRNYTEPTLDAIGRVVAMAVRLGRSEEPEPLPAVIARVRVPVVLLLGGVASAAGPSAEELAALAPLGPRLRVERLPGVAHFLHEEAPGEVLRHLVGSRPEQAGGTGPRRPAVGSDRPRR